MDEMNEKDVDVAEEEKEDDLLTCPVCGEEVESGTENCPLCGAPVGTLENNDISGTSIDNSAAIDAMLQSAAMLVEESASLGVGSLDDDEDENDEDEAAVQEEAAGYEEEEEDEEEEEEEEADPMEPTNASALPSELTAEQMDKIKAGGMINISAGAPGEQSKPKKAKPPKKKKKSDGPVLYNVDELGNQMPETEEPVVEEPPPPPPKEKKPAPKKEKKKGTSPILVVLAAVVALALGCTAGFFAKTVFFPDFTTPDCQDFAQRAVLSVNSIIEKDQTIYVAEAYVRDTDDSTQCVFRAFVDSGEDEADSRWFRVKVYKDSPDTVRVYHQLDMEQYEELMSSDDQEKQIQASMLMNNQLELERCIDEIQSSGTAWSAANAVLLNNSLHPFTEQETAESAR